MKSAAKQRVRAVAAHQKEEKRAKEAGGKTSLTPKTVAKPAKRKPDGSDAIRLKRPPSLLGIVLQWKNPLLSQAMVRARG